MLLLAAAGVAVRMEQVAEEKRILDEVEARHRETVKRMEAYQKRSDEINAIANAKIGTPEFIQLMMQFNEKGLTVSPHIIR